MTNVEKVITSAIYSLKERLFNMTDIFLVVGSYCTIHGYQITMEQICDAADKLGEAGIIEHTATPDGLGALKLSEKAIANIMENPDLISHGR